MVHLRIGKTISIRWRLFISGRPITSDDNLTLFITDSKGRKERVEISNVADGILSAVYKTTFRSALGVYTLTVWLDYGSDYEAPVDAINAFALVPFSNQETTNIDPETGIVILESNIEIGAADTINGHNTIFI